MKHSDLTKSKLTENFGPNQEPKEPTWDWAATPPTSQSSSNWLPPTTPLNDYEHVSQGPSRASQFKQQASQLGQGLKGVAGTAGSKMKQGAGAIASGIGNVAKGTPGAISKGLDWFDRVRNGAIQGWQQAQQRHEGQRKSAEIAKTFINQWRQAIGQDPSLNTPQDLMAFAEKIAPELASDPTIGDNVMPAQITLPKDMSPAGVAKYITDVVSKDMAASTIYGSDRTPPEMAAQEKADYDAAQKQVRINALVKQIEQQEAEVAKSKAELASMTMRKDSVKYDTATDPAMAQAAVAGHPEIARAVAQSELEAPSKGIPTATTESKNFSAAIWRQMRESK